MKAAFYTLGCKVNQYETQLMIESLKNAGFEIVDSTAKADVYIINSCTVTAVSNQKTRQSLRAFKRKNPDSITVLAGCMSQAYPEQTKKLDEADIIIGNTEHKKIPELINRFLNDKKKLYNIEEHPVGEAFESGIIHSFDGKTRAEVKIEDGCNRFCSYCAIPYARGRVRSKPLKTILQEVNALAEAGYKEIVLVGINLSAYKDGENDLSDVVLAVDKIESIQRIRLGSLEPDHITDEIISKLKRSDKFCPQFHISLQSGCDKTLKAMNRHYSAAEYESLCLKLRSAFSECTLTTDVMTGFPGETQDDHKESLDFVKKIGFEKLHIFPYSIREGTKAAKMPGQLTKQVKSQRAKEMICLGESIRKAFFDSQKGKEVEVLFENKKGEYYIGHTKNYIPLKVKTDEDLQYKIRIVKIKSSDAESCYGELS